MAHLTDGASSTNPSRAWSMPRLLTKSMSPACWSIGTLCRPQDARSASTACWRSLLRPGPPGSRGTYDEPRRKAVAKLICIFPSTLYTAGLLRTLTPCLPIGFVLGFRFCATYSGGGNKGGVEGYSSYGVAISYRQSLARVCNASWLLAARSLYTVQKLTRCWRPPLLGSPRVYRERMSPASTSV